MFDGEIVKKKFPLKEKESVCRKALLQKSKHDRLVNRMKKAGKHPENYK